MAKQTKEFESMPPVDAAAKIALEMLDADKMISEGHERHAALELELGDLLIQDKKSKINIKDDEGKMHTFTVRKIAAKIKISHRTERED